MKTPKTYRLSQISLEKLNDLKKHYPNRTETEIIEWAIINAWHEEMKEDEND